jgi:hypothetical protein
MSLFSGIDSAVKGTMSEKKLQELKAEREPLYAQLVKNPNEIHLALEIKTIDDQIAECIIQQKKKTPQLTR